MKKVYYMCFGLAVTIILLFGIAIIPSLRLIQAANNKEEVKIQKNYQHLSFKSLDDKIKLIGRFSFHPDMEIADIDGDGDNDIIIISSGTGEIVFIENKMNKK